MEIVRRIWIAGHADAILQGHLDTYRFCDEVWTFIIKDVKFKLDNTNTVEAERVKIVACQSKEKTQ